MQLLTINATFITLWIGTIGTSNLQPRSCIVAQQPPSACKVTQTCANTSYLSEPDLEFISGKEQNMLYSFTETMQQDCITDKVKVKVT